MEAIKMNSEETYDRHTRIKQNVRVVSGKSKNRLARISSKISSDSRVSSASSSGSPKCKRVDNNENIIDQEVPLDFENLRKQIIRRVSTVPDLFEKYDLKTIHEEKNLRKKFREAIRIRNHTSPFTNEKVNPSSRWKNAYKSINVAEHSVGDALDGLTEKEEKQFMDQIARKQSLSGLWNMASSTFYEYKACKSRNIEDLAMALISKQLAVKKMRNKISQKLELPEDKFKRIAILRQNVNFIEQKFDNLKNPIIKKVISSSNVNMYPEMNVNDQPSRFTKAGEAKAFFRKCGRIVLIVLNWIFLIMDGSDSSKLERELKSFVDIAQEVADTVTSSQAMEEQGLSFDKQVYKANREISLTQDHRKTLTTRWNFRSPDMVKQVMHGLQALKSLADYPLRTQERLCQVAWYQTIGPKRVILRQGHNAESFYFILSGTAFVKKIMRNERTGESKIQVAARLTKGQSFGFSWEDGEVGLIFNTKRTATVESNTPMELLVIGKEDFNSIFMNSEDHDQEAEHVEFLRQVPMMSEWPVECLKNEPGTCVLHYFKRGNLITANGKTSEWLYFVKSGTCEVMKELKPAKARKSGKSYIRPDPMSDIFLPELGLGASSRVDTGIAHKRKFVMTPEIFEEMSQYYEKLKQMLPTASMLEKEAPPKREISDVEEDKTVRKNSVFVHVQLLQSKDVFGMNTLTGWNAEEVDDMMDEAPALCLVSRGAEIVMLSKKTFVKYINDKVRKMLRTTLRPYPTESKLQETFQTKVDWEDYKTNLLDNVLKHQCLVKSATGLV